MKKINSQTDLKERIELLQKESEQLEKEIARDYKDICNKATDSLHNWQYGVTGKAIKWIMRTNGSSSPKPWWKKIVQFFK